MNNNDSQSLHYVENERVYIKCYEDCETANE